MDERMVGRIELRALEELVPYARNARTHSAEQIAALRGSLREFGFVSPVLIDRAGNILAGHGRVMAARAEGFHSVPCVPVEHLSETQRRAYILADNKLAELADWDEELLALELEELDAAGFDLALSGFELPTLDEPEAQVQEDDFDCTPEEEPRAKRGGFYQLGRHLLLCGDATDAQDVALLMGGEKVQLLLTDPPYNVDYSGADGTRQPLANDKMADAAYSDFLARALRHAAAHMPGGASFYLWHASGSTAQCLQAMEQAGLRARQTLIWCKQSFVLSRQDYHWQHEPCFYGWTDGAAHHWYGGRAQSSMLQHDRPIKSTEHPTMKPVALFAQLIQNSSARDENVLDLFGGSGTTLIACEESGRSCRMMELEPRYVDVIVRRWEALTGQKAQLLN